jgi:hypothetical protein
MKITLEGVKKACREYHAKGMLLAQQKPGASVRYGYRVHRRRCAIGAALDGSTLDKITRKGLHAETIKSAVKNQVDLPFEWSKDEEEALIDIQVAHDNWLSFVEDSHDGDVFEEQFLELIND